MDKLGAAIRWCFGGFWRFIGILFILSIFVQGAVELIPSEQPDCTLPDATQV